MAVGERRSSLDCCAAVADDAPPAQLVATAAAAAAPDIGVLTTAVGGVLLTDTLKSIGADTVISIARDGGGGGCSSGRRLEKRKNAPVRA